MSPSLRVAGLLACSALVLAVVAGGAGTGALLSDNHVATGNVTVADGVDTTSTVDAVKDPENASGEHTGPSASSKNASTSNEGTSRGNASTGTVVGSANETTDTERENGTASSSR